MSSVDRRKELSPGSDNGYSNGVVEPVSIPTRSLCAKANTEHKPDTYDDLELEFNPLLFKYLEQYLPSTMLNLSRDSKIHYMKQIVHKYWPEGERTRVHRHRDYRHKIISDYTPLHEEIYSLHPASFFVPSFLQAIKENNFRNMLSEPAPGIYTFEIFQPSFCDMLLEEVVNFQNWVSEINFRIIPPNAMNKHGVVLGDFGLEAMLNRLMDDYIRPLAKVVFPDVGGSTLDSHHGFVVEYGIDRNVDDVGLHVDDAEVTMNVCLGKQFFGGDLLFGGVRCDKHVNTLTKSEEMFDYVHVPGQAVLHRGRHRRCARATTDGHRVNLIMWCRSSVFREMRKYQNDLCSWCGECQREATELQKLSISIKKMELLKMDVENQLPKL